MVKNKKIIILSLLILFCSKINLIHISLDEQNDTGKKTFIDKDSILMIKIEDRYEYTENINEEKKTYMFEWYQEVEMKDGKKSKQFQYSLEIQIIPMSSNLYRNVMLANYESEFISQCKCNINKKGWILHQKENLRIFDYNIDKFYFISYQFNRKQYFIQINIKSNQYDLTLNLANIILENTQLL